MTHRIERQPGYDYAARNLDSIDIASLPVSPRPDQWLKLFQTFSELLGDFLCAQHGSRQM